MKHTDIAVTQLAILAGGKGHRLMPTTEYLPKALVEIDGRPILDHILDFYKSKGFTEAVLCVGYKAQDIKRHYGSRHKGMKINYSNAGEEAGLLKRIWKLQEVDGERFLISYCDTFIDLELERLLACHQEKGAHATVVTAAIRNPFGIVSTDVNGWVDSFVEKPTFNYYIGCFLIERSAFQFATPEIIESKDGEGLVVFFNRLAEAKRLAAFDHNRLQITFNTETERQAAEHRLIRFYTYPEEK